MLIKQIPAPDELRMENGRLVRDGVALEVNAYCRRANAKAIELASGDEVVVFTMGPPAAADALAEMIACGATRGVHLCDPAFAGADTLATSRALAAAVAREGPFALLLAGLNSLDADTGQVGPQVAVMLGLPFLPGARVLDVVDGEVSADLETDDGVRRVICALPAVVSTTERLCEPSKAPPEARAQVPASLIAVKTAASLMLTADDVGAAGSPTSVGPSRLVASTRRRLRVADAAAAVDALDELDALAPEPDARETVPETGGAGPGVWCFIDGTASLSDQNLLGASAVLAAAIGGAVTAVVPAPVPAGLGSQGADRVFCFPPGSEFDQWADALGDAIAFAQPAIVLVEGTRLGRALASTIAARHGWGLVGDAIDVELSTSGRLIAWKPAFGGQLVSPIESRSLVQLATVRPGVFARRQPRPWPDPVPQMLEVSEQARVRTVSTHRDDEYLSEFLLARHIIGVGTGVDPGDYDELAPLQAALGGAPLAATRRVTDRGWLPRSRQVGITGHSIAPRLYVAIGISGKLNHVVGIRAAGTVLAVNNDPDAPVFEHADVGVVGDWRTVVPELAMLLAARNFTASRDR